MRRWIEEGNKGNVSILGIRWLLKEHRRAGKLASSLVIYLKDSVDINRGLEVSGSHGEKDFPHHTVRLGQIGACLPQFPPELCVVLSTRALLVFILGP